MKKSLGIIVFLGLVLLLASNFGFYKNISGLTAGITSPVQIAFYAAGHSLGNKLSTIFEIGNLRQENADLKQKLFELESTNAHLQNISQENAALQAQLGVTLGASTRLIGARVLGFTPLATRNLLNLDKGTESGVKIGQTVVLKDTLLGKISQVGERTSTAQLLSDPEVKILAETSTQAKGIVIGEFGSKIKITKVLLEEKLSPGDYVYSSGDENFPKGLVVGKITKVNRLESELFQEAEVSPLYDLGNLEVVFIQAL